MEDIDQQLMMEQENQRALEQQEVPQEVTGTFLDRLDATVGSGSVIPPMTQDEWKTIWTLASTFTLMVTDPGNPINEGFRAAIQFYAEHGVTPVEKRFVEALLKAIPRLGRMIEIPEDILLASDPFAERHEGGGEAVPPQTKSGLILPESYGKPKKIITLGGV